MMKQVSFVSEYEGGTKSIPSINIAECKHQIKFLEILFLLFQHLKKCELIVTSLKYNNFYFDHFFKALKYEERKKLVIEHIVLPNETDRKN